ncbi:cytosolic enolase 3-like [Macadamia integrifolia]|uniref:cytosolic enolase 3-like n=1 Tax=Macadamia integrifolia TaxID=60698 RepID=UPI001C4E654A|nr:cytosolic enolase 3-like [Macadamia integrifolia]
MLLMLCRLGKGSRSRTAHLKSYEKKAVPSVITKIKARQILDSSGIPTVEVDLYTNKGVFRAPAPSGVSTGIYKGKYLGHGVS